MELNEYIKVVGCHSEEFIAQKDQFKTYFDWAIHKMNSMYNLAINDTPTLNNLKEQPSTRLKGFLKTLQDELDEGKDILKEMEVLDQFKSKHDQETLSFREQDITKKEQEILVNLADWLGDMIVYIKSEALKYGIPLDAVLTCIMGSNFTKLGEDGKPIMNLDGKVLKGPNFEPPEKYIHATLFEEKLKKEIEDTKAKLNSISG
jgi:predicted HAD superfamily Cof-like phosphohydrolase